MVQWTFGRKGTREQSWTCDHIITSAVGRTQAAWAHACLRHECYLCAHTDQNLTSLLQILLWFLLFALLRNYKWSNRYIHAFAGIHFRPPSGKLSEQSPQQPPWRLSSPFLPPSSNLHLSKKKKKSLFCPIWELGCLWGFRKIIFSGSCPISSCTDLVPIKEPPESHFLLHISKCFSCKSFPSKLPSQKALGLKEGLVLWLCFS